MTMYIKEGELIVGNFASDSYFLPYYPELYWRWLEKAVEEGYSSLIDEAGKKDLKEINQYWHNRAVHGMEKV